MDPSLERAKHILSHIRRAPSMMASTKEAYMCIVCTILAMADIILQPEEFFLVYIKTKGSVYVDIHEEMRGNDEWAHKVCDDALARIEAKANLK